MYFLTGKQLFSEKGLSFIKENGVSPDDYCGHGTIRKWYGIDSGDGKDKECVDFSSPTNLPAVIVRAIKRGDMAGFAMPDGLLSKPLDDDYEAKRKPLYADYEAKRDALYDDYEAKRDALYDDYWALFADPENRAEAWR